MWHAPSSVRSLGPALYERLLRNISSMVVSTATNRHRKSWWKHLVYMLNAYTVYPKLSVGRVPDVGHPLPQHSRGFPSSP